MNEHAEKLMRQVRELLGFARDMELSGAIELADAAGAIAANKLAQVLRITEPNPPRRAA